MMLTPFAKFHASFLLLLAASLLAQSGLTTKPAAIERLKASIERTTASINATWGIYVKCLEAGEEIALQPPSSVNN